MTLLPPGGRIPVVVANDTSMQHVGCQAVMQTLRGMLQDAGCDIIHSQSVRDPWEEDPAFKAAAAKAAAIVVNGEGSIHRSNPRAQQLARLGPYARSLGIPSVLLNATLALNKAPLYKDLKQFSMISLRDRASVAEAKKFGVTEAEYCPDFSLHKDLYMPSQSRPPGTGLRVAATDTVVKTVAAQLASLREARGIAESRMKWSREGVHLTIEGYAQSLRELDILISGRFHAVCFAINTRTPFIAIESNTPKITSLLKDVFGSARRVLTFEQIEACDLPAYAQWTPEEEAALAAFQAVRRERYAAMAERMASVIGGAQV